MDRIICTGCEIDMDAYGPMICAKSRRTPEPQCMRCCDHDHA